jgi:hypothetical protein
MIGDNKLKDLTGKRFGCLTVLHQCENKPHISYTGAFWTCRCDCGNTTNVRSCHLLSGHTKTCGCGRKEAAKLIRKRRPLKTFEQKYKYYKHKFIHLQNVLKEKDERIELLKVTMKDVLDENEELLRKIHKLELHKQEYGYGAFFDENI